MSLRSKKLARPIPSTGNGEENVAEMIRQVKFLSLSERIH